MKKYRVSNKRKSMYKLTYTIYDFYESYPNKDNVDKALFISILKDFFSLLVKKVIQERKRIILPYNLNLHRIKKVKLNSKGVPKIDFNKSKQYNTKIYHLNTHTSGFHFKWFWDKGYILIKNKNIYRFELSKKNTLLLASEILKCSKDPYLKDYDALR